MSHILFQKLISPILKEGRAWAFKEICILSWVGVSLQICRICSHKYEPSFKLWKNYSLKTVTTKNTIHRKRWYYYSLKKASSTCSLIFLPADGSTTQPIFFPATTKTSTKLHLHKEYLLPINVHYSKRRILCLWFVRLYGTAL